jgi:benzil reductase ((S)-benzoin forming)
MRKVWITGTSQGLGNALAAEYLKQGWYVEGWSRNHNLKHERYTAVHVNLSEADFLQDGTFDGIEAYDECLLILNAGAVQPIKHCGNFDNDTALKTIAVNYSSVVTVCNAFMARVKDMTDKQCGILYISSGAARNPYDGWSVYCSSKAASEMFIRCISEELKACNIRHINVYSVAPGVVKTTMQDTIRLSRKADFSRVQHFINLHEKQSLQPAASVAERLYTLWQQRRNYPDVCLDLRLLQNL